MLVAAKKPPGAATGTRQSDVQKSSSQECSRFVHCDVRLSQVGVRGRRNVGHETLRKEVGKKTPHDTNKMSGIFGIR